MKISKKGDNTIRTMLLLQIKGQPFGNTNKCTAEVEDKEKEKRLVTPRIVQHCGSTEFWIMKPRFK